MMAIVSIVVCIGKTDLEGIKYAILYIGTIYIYFKVLEYEIK